MQENEFESCIPHASTGKLQRRQERSSRPERPPSLMVLGIPALAQKPNNALGDFDSFSFPLL